MPRVVHFEINADSPERAVRFYEKVFGWKIAREGPIDYWLAETGEQSQPGINGAIMKRVKKETVFMIIDVPSIDACVEKIAKEGGKLVIGKGTVPGIGYSAYFTDSEGNMVGLIQQDKSAR
jgi:predicted enzyme related to lactoylglutathione lyase